MSRCDEIRVKARKSYWLACKCPNCGEYNDFSHFNTSYHHEKVPKKR